MNILTLLRKPETPCLETKLFKYWLVNFSVTFDTCSYKVTKNLYTRILATLKTQY